MSAWSDATVVVAAGTSSCVYVGGFVRARKTRGRSHLPPWRAWSFLAGAAAAAAAVLPPFDGWADDRLSAHMAQHMLLTLVAPPLILLGAPITLALLASSDRTRHRLILPLLRSRTVRVLSSPPVAFLLFMGVLWGSHLTFVYEAAVRSDAVHAGEHAVYLGAALLFWWPVVGADAYPSRMSHPGRILYLFLAMAQMAYLGSMIYGARSVLYASYRAADPHGALADQQLAGGLMWTAGMFLMVPVLGVVIWDWMSKEERLAARTGDGAQGATAGVGGVIPREGGT